MSDVRTTPTRRICRRLSRAAALVIVAAILGGDSLGSVTTGPQPPCDGASFPPYPDLEHSPTVIAWDRAESGADWTPPPCTGWTEPGFTTLVATAGRFRQADGVDGVLRRIGAISELAGIRYWSTTRKRWRTLIVGARALSDPAGDGPREDFSPAEMTEGRSLYFEQKDNLSGKAIYRMRIRTVTADRLVIDTENISTVRYFLVPVFRPGGIQSVTFLDREPQDVWRYYSVTRTGKAANPLIAGYEASAINRAVAYYRHLAGIPTDEEPPAAP